MGAITYFLLHFIFQCFQNKTKTLPFRSHHLFNKYELNTNARKWQDENEKDTYLILRRLQSREREINLLTVMEWGPE